MCVPYIISWEVAVNHMEFRDAYFHSTAWIVFYETILKRYRKIYFQCVQHFKHSVFESSSLGLPSPIIWPCFSFSEVVRDCYSSSETTAIHSLLLTVHLPMVCIVYLGNSVSVLKVLFYLSVNQAWCVDFCGHFWSLPDCALDTTNPVSAKDCSDSCTAPEKLSIQPLFDTEEAPHCLEQFHFWHLYFTSDFVFPTIDAT